VIPQYSNFSETALGKKEAVQSGKEKNRVGIITKLHVAITAENHVVEGMLTGAKYQTSRLQVIS
jgi:hypothetical protein